MAQPSSPRQHSGKAPRQSSSVFVAQTGILLACALGLAALEAFFPLPIPVPGVKLGLANIVVVLAAYTQGSRSASCICIARIVLIALFAGQLATLPFSAAGGLCALAVSLLGARYKHKVSLRLASLGAAVVHNVAQLAVAIVITNTPQLMWYGPILLLVALATGYITGSLAQIVYTSLPATWHESRSNQEETRN